MSPATPHRPAGPTPTFAQSLGRSSKPWDRLDEIQARLTAADDAEERQQEQDRW